MVGEIGRPGSYPLTRRMTVLDAIAMAGGFKDFAKTKKIYMLRQRQWHRAALAVQLQRSDQGQEPAAEYRAAAPGHDCCPVTGGEDDPSFRAAPDRRDNSVLYVCLGPDRHRRRYGHHASCSTGATAGLHLSRHDAIVGFPDRIDREQQHHIGVNAGFAFDSNGYPNRHGSQSRWLTNLGGQHPDPAIPAKVCVEPRRTAEGCRLTQQTRSRRTGNTNLVLPRRRAAGFIWQFARAGKCWRTTATSIRLIHSPAF